MQTMSDRLFSKFDQAAKEWGEVANNQSVSNRNLLRKRNAYYKARTELVQYLESLERTIVEYDNARSR